MKAPVPTPLRRYRNAVVYQSAERLIASGAKKSLWKRAPRAVLFLTGLVCGAVLVFLLFRPARETARNMIRSLTATNEQVRPGDRRNARVIIAPPNAIDATTLASPIPSLGSPPPLQSADMPAATPAPFSSRPALPSPLSRSSLATRPVYAPPAQWITMASSTTGLNLRGEMHPTGGEPIPIEFQLRLVVTRPQGGSVAGAVEFSGDVFGRDPIPVSGTWFDHTVTLRQLHNRVSEIASLRPSTHSFGLEFPSDTQSDVITGTWTNGPRSGKLTLKTVPVL